MSLSNIYCRHMNKDYSDKMTIKGSKIAELSYMYDILSHKDVNPKQTLIIGEREGREGVSLYTSHTMDLNNDTIVCLDITDVEPNSYVSDLSDSEFNFSFIKSDLIKYNPDTKFNYIVCISVLEHFGLKYGNRNMFDDDDYFETMNDDVIRWNHDIRGLIKMGELLSDNNSTAIITVPSGGYMNYDDNGFPFLRYYNHQRRGLIINIMNKNGFDIFNEKFYITDDFVNWSETTSDSMKENNYRIMNPYSPNGLWCFCVKKTN